MEQKQILVTLKKLKDSSKKRNFKQSIDLIVTFKDIDMKKTENQLNIYASVPNPTGKKIRVCTLVGPEMKEEAKVADKVVLFDEFDKYKSDKKLTKKLANECDFFIAQANLMVKVAGAFGRVLGPKGKMPNPKAGCVVPPRTNLKPIIEKLKHSIKLTSRNTYMVQCSIGREDMDENKIAENAISIYNQIVHALPQEKNNIKNAMLKLTMSKPMKIE